MKYRGYKNPEKKRRYQRKYYYKNRKSILNYQMKRRKIPKIRKDYNDYMRKYMKKHYKKGGKK